MLKFVLVKICPLIRILSTVESYICPSFVGTYTMLGNFYSDMEMSHNQRFQFGKKKNIDISTNRGHLLSRDIALLLRCRRGNVS